MFVIKSNSMPVYVCSIASGQKCPVVEVTSILESAAQFPDERAARELLNALAEAGETDWRVVEG